MSTNPCEHCGAANRAERRFCAECGKSLAKSCLQCGFENTPGEKFCGGCGVALGAKEPEKAALLPMGERRQVTVLFADIAGYTRLSHDLDPEDTHQLLESFFEIADGAVARYGGRVDKHIGDNVMAVFGAPVAHDNDPERAVRAAREIHERVEALRTPSSVPIRVHIGIATGEVIASALGSRHHQEYGVIGDAVNLAARLQDKATSGETVVTDAVRIATADIASYESMGEVSLKGFRLPLVLWKFQALGAQKSDRVERPFVGREAERELLTSALRDAQQNGTGSTLLLRGEPGIGKTRLVRETRLTAERLGYRAHRTLILDFGAGADQGPMGMLTASLLGIAERASEAERRAAVDRAVAERYIEADQSHALAALLDCPLTPAEQKTHAAMDLIARETSHGACIARLIQHAAADAPVFVSIEDAHWADSPTLRLVGAVVEAASKCPAVVVMTARPEGDPLAESRRALVERAPIRPIDLSALTAGEALRLATSGGITPIAARACIERAGGNPLFLEQLLETNSGGDGQGLPPTLQSVVLARVDRLPSPERTALQVASVVGQRFAPELVRALLEDEGFSFERLIAQRLVRPEGEALLFQHALIQQGVYASLTRARKRELHLKLAQHPSTDLVLQAQHLDRAQDPAAAQRYLEAAAFQVARHLLESAASLNTRGAVLVTEQPLRYALKIQRAEILGAMGSNADAAKAYAEALTEASTDRERCTALIGIGGSNRFASRYGEVTAPLDEAEPLAVALADEDALAAIYYHRGGVAFANARHNECRSHYQKSLQYAERCRLPERIARAWSGMGDSAFAMGDLLEAERAFRRCIDVADAAGLERVKLLNWAMLANVLLFTGGVTEALEVLRRAQASAKQLGDHRAAFFIDMELGFTTGYYDSLEEGLKLLQVVLQTALKMNLKLYLGEIFGFVAELHELLGNRELGLEMARRAVQAERDSNGGLFSAPALALCAKLTSDGAERAALLKDARTLARNGGMFLSNALYFRFLLDCGLENRDFALIDEGIAGMESAMKYGRYAFFDFFIRRGELLRDVLQGRTDDALLAELRAMHATMVERKIQVGRREVAAAIRDLEQRAA